MASRFLTWAVRNMMVLLVMIRNIRRKVDLEKNNVAEIKGEEYLSKGETSKKSQKRSISQGLNSVAWIRQSIDHHW